MRSIAVVNQKGGAGKTVTAWALAATLRARGHQVTLLDSDPQRTLQLLDPSTEHVDVGGLRLAVRAHGGSDFVIVDTPPALGEETRAATEVCDGLLIPCRATYLDLRGLGALLARVDPGKVIGIVITAWRGEYVRHERIIAQRIAELGFPILGRIPLSVVVAEAALMGKPITQYGPAKARGVRAAYETLAEAVESWSKTG